MGYCRTCLRVEQDTRLYMMDSQLKEIIRNELGFDVNVDPQDNHSQEICRKCKEKLKDWKTFKAEAIKKQRVIEAVKAKQKEINNNEEKTQKKDKNVSESTSQRKQLDGTDRKKQSNIVVQVPEETSAKDISVQPVGGIANESKPKKKSRPENATEVTSHKSRSDSNNLTDTSTVQSAEVGTSIAINSYSTASNEEVITIDDHPVILKNIVTEPGTVNHLNFVESLQDHQQTNHHSNLLKCPECPRSFIERDTFIRHLRAHLGVKLPQMMCGTCFQVYNSPKELAQHRRSTHQSAKSIGNLCDEKFASSTKLKKHKKSHRIQNNKDFSCIHCKKKFRSASLKKKHKCTALKFICPKNCGKRFKYSSNLKRHSKKCSRLTTSKREFRPRKVKTKANLRINLTRCIERADLRDTFKIVDREKSHCYPSSSIGQPASNTDSAERVELPKPIRKIAHDNDDGVYDYHSKTRKALWCAPTETSRSNERSTGEDDNSRSIENKEDDGDAKIKEKIDPKIEENLAAMLSEFQDSNYRKCSPALKNKDRSEEFDKQKLPNQGKNATRPEKPRESIDNEEQIKKKIKLTDRSGSSSKDGSNDHVSNNSSKLVNTPADTSCITESERKQAFKMSMGNFVVSCLNPYFRINCAQARIMNEMDFRYLARKLTHAIMEKELKHCSSVTDLTFNSIAKRKAEDEIRMCMSKFGEIYVRSPDDTSC